MLSPVVATAASTAAPAAATAAATAATAASTPTIGRHVRCNTREVRDKNQTEKITTWLYFWY